MKKTRKVIKDTDTSDLKGIKFTIEDLEFANRPVEYEYVPILMNERNGQENVAKTLKEKSISQSTHNRKNMERHELKDILEKEKKALENYCSGRNFNTSGRKKAKKEDTVCSY